MKKVFPVIGVAAVAAAVVFSPVGHALTSAVAPGAAVAAPEPAGPLPPEPDPAHSKKCNGTKRVKGPNGGWVVVPAVDGKPFECVLAGGMKGDPVKALQRSLKTCNDQPALSVDGEVGPKTTAAVKAVQKELDLPKDGEAGPETFSLMNWLREDGKCDGIGARLRLS